MIDANALWVFVTAGIALNIAPGPDVLYIVGRSVGQGRAAGLVSALGIAVGCLFHVAAAALGLSALMLALPLAFDLVRLAGAGYLLWLGAKLILSRGGSLAPARLTPVPLARIFRQGVLTNVLNPKVALFFLAFLPQFADASRGALAPQILALGLIFVANGLWVCCLYALLGSRIGDWLRGREGAAAWLDRATGALFVALGLRLAWAGRD